LTFNRKEEAIDKNQSFSNNYVPVTKPIINKKQKLTIKEVIFNEKSTISNPVKDSDYVVNFKQPNKEDYRIKRTMLLYPPSNGEFFPDTEYRDNFNKKKP
jgi:hypothetical protein